jgi:hypothetical protein
MAGKSKQPGSFTKAAGVVRFLLRRQNRGLVMTAIVIVASIGGAMYAWQRWGAPLTDASDYAVTPERIAVTPQPTWIGANVKAEVLRNASLTRLDVRNPRLVEQVTQAFALHAWVAKVVRVEKRYPPHIAVELAYRRPALVIKLDSQGEKDLLVVDEQSVLLPSVDFAPTAARGYLRIMAAGETPAGVYGTPWGSQRIAGAARLAAAWGTRWQPLGLYWIVTSRGGSGELAYELRTQDEKVRVIWGSLPGRESSGEPSAAQRISALERYVYDKGPLNKIDTPTVIDLCELAGSSDHTAKRTAGPNSGRH